MKYKFNFINFIKTNLVIFISAILSYIICKYYFENLFFNQTLFASAIVLANIKELKMEKWRALIFYISALNIIFFLTFFLSIPIYRIFKNLSSGIMIIFPILITISVTDKILKVNKISTIILVIILHTLILVLTNYSKSIFPRLEDPWIFFFWIQIILGVILSFGINIFRVENNKNGVS
ncbi:hypothetical protein [Riemerella anatipestifer]|uniref:Uncharacterized protein n=1 Tax=Riemerella anatipestifer TaxID=34085 RepID=A0A1S7DUK8_RIEAN|nr:hypothetical protein [Riemerella anatipestifer]AQY22794.1 hypothetical protein AB406_1853 [Riemerella anatipestifer]MCO4304436.1 hypothetical protein [Riemerella anatipestifer]MCO7352014.1 hypothetical protein [Riemerella anatipestifer]MCQ4038940.1 hypothetical protein [Riemerella anatipestifer]MCT6761408.1 hypothetical protein [Riemerella anatipestifer]